MNNQRINRVIVPVVIEIKVTYGCGHHLITAIYTLRSINKAGIKPKLGPSKRDLKRKIPGLPLENT